MHLLKRLTVLLRSREVEPGKRCMRVQDANVGRGVRG